MTGNIATAGIRRGALLIASALLLFWLTESAGAREDSDSRALANAGPASDAVTPASAPSAEPAAAPESAESTPTPAYSQSVSPDTGGLERVSVLPPEAFSEQSQGIPYSSVLNHGEFDPNDINSFNGTLFRTGVSNPMKLGAAEGGFGFQTGNLGLSTDFLHTGVEPDNADIKAGPFYIKFHSLDGLVLYTDNSQRSEDDRKREVLILVSLDLTIIAQINDNLQFTLSGSIVYLPLQNQFGLESSAASDLGILILAAPGFAAQLAYNTDIGGWPVTFTDSFTAGTGAYSGGVQDNFDLFRGDYLQRDETGNYTFHSSQSQPLSQTTERQNEALNNPILYFRNTMSAATDRLLPGDVRLTVQVSHENLWYNQNNRGLPSGRDDLNASLVSERASQRFKPYVSYDASYIEGYSNSIVQSLDAGIIGPIDDQIFLNASVGAYLDANGHDGLLYALSVAHTAGTYTHEYLTLNRSLSIFYQEQWTSEYYRLDQVLGPTLSADLFLAHASFENLTGDGAPNHSEYLGGLEFTWVLGPKTTLILAGIADEELFTGGEKTQTFTGRCILNRVLTDSLTCQLLYEYQRSAANRSGDSFTENLIYFRVVKYFY